MLSSAGGGKREKDWDLNISKAQRKKEGTEEGGVKKEGERERGRTDCKCTGPLRGMRRERGWTGGGRSRYRAFLASLPPLPLPPILRASAILFPREGDGFQAGKNKEENRMHAGKSSPKGDGKSVGSLMGATKNQLQEMYSL